MKTETSTKSTILLVVLSVFLLLIRRDIKRPVEDIL